VPVHVVDGFEMVVDRGPNWLFIKLRLTKNTRAVVPQVAEKLWSIASRHFIYRLVLELDELEELPPGMMSQLIMLQQRLRQCGGALRICGLSPECEESLQSYELSSALQNHASRTEAVMGSGEFAAVPR
jgi:hypothetical protein